MSRVCVLSALEVPMMIFGRADNGWMVEVFAACFWIVNIPISCWIVPWTDRVRLGWDVPELEVRMNGERINGL